MAFPSSPSNGATYVSNGVTYTFNSSTSQWVGALPTSSGGGSMGAPTHFGRFTLRTSFNSAEHTGGNASGYIGQALGAFTTANTLNVKDKAAIQGNISISSDAANYGTAIVAGGTTQDFSTAPQFCSDAAYLASNPVWVSYGGSQPATNGYYYCADTGLVRTTNDSGATFSTFVPQLISNGKIKLVTPGKYKVKVRHMCDITGVNSSAFPIVHTLIFINDVIKVNYPDIARWEFKGNSTTNGLDSKLKNEFDSILETTTANTEFSLGLTKLGVNVSTTSTFIITVESLF